MSHEHRIKEFGSKIYGLMRGKDLTRQETKSLFSQILLNEQPDIQQGGFLAALTAKGETPEEIAGAWEAIYELDTAKIKIQAPQPIVENCGTGMDELKTLNISTAAAIIAAAGGVHMAKHGARAITSKCGAVDILERLGVDVECDIDVVRRSIEGCGIGIFNGMSSKVHPQALGRILSQIRFGTTINIAGSLANPAFPQYALRGVYSKDMLKLVAQVMSEIGYRQAIVVHGLDGAGNKGMDELSTLGRTIICELREDGRIEEYTLEPEDVGLSRAKYEDICPASSLEEEAMEFLRVISGKEEGPKCDIVCLNAAPIFYLMKKVKSIEDGIQKSRELIEAGVAVRKLNEWVSEKNQGSREGVKKLESLMKRI